MEASNPKKVKENNLLYLVNLIKNYGPLSKRELAELSGLSVVTINKLIPDLLERKFVLPFSDEVVTGGRYAVSYIFNVKKYYSLIVKMVEKDNHIFFFFYLSDINGKIVDEREISSDGLEWEDFLTIIRTLKKDYPSIKSIVLGIPGVEIDGIIKLVDFPLLLGKEIRKELTKTFDCVIQIENDVNAAILGYSEKRTKDKIIAGIYYPIAFPPGGGVSFYQQLLKGKNNFIGEVSTLPINVDWSKENISKIDLRKHFKDVCQTFIALYDPHEIVLYLSEKRMEEMDIKNVVDELQKIYPLIDIPKIELSNQFNEDYRLGLISLGVRDLNDLLSLDIKRGN